MHNDGYDFHITNSDHNRQNISCCHSANNQTTLNRYTIQISLLIWLEKSNRKMVKIKYSVSSETSLSSYLIKPRLLIIILLLFAFS